MPASFRMPAEFEPHARTWMLWPERPDTWRDDARPAQLAFARLAATIARFEPVAVGANPDQLVTARLALPPEVDVVELPCDDAWMRDTGPTFLVNDQGELCGVDWDFNAWGGLYPDFERDAQVAARVLEIEGVPRIATPGFILEGGSIHVDGQGTCLTTEMCLLDASRNPHLTKSDIQSWLCVTLGVQKVIWLGRGVLNDETSGHVDNLCCFTRPGVIALTWCDDPTDPMYAICRDAAARLEAATDAHGRRLEIHPIHQPSPLYRTAAESGTTRPTHAVKPRSPNERLAASYINFYIANGAVIVPQFDDPRDQPALDTLQALFPERQVIGLPGREILLGGGNIHCITQQQPQATT